MATVCYSLSKYGLVIVSVIFLIVGIAALILGGWMIIDKTFFVSISQKKSYDAGLYIMLATASFMVIIACLGFVGALKNSRTCLACFISVLLVVIVAQVASGCWLLAHEDQLDQLIRSCMINTVKLEYGEIESRTEIMDVIQSDLKCCGATGPADYAGSAYSNKDSSMPLLLTVSSDPNNLYKVPESCCKDSNSIACKEGRSIKVAGIVGPAIYSEGCMENLMQILKDEFYYFIGALIINLIIEVVALILALICFCQGGSSDRYKA
ncbi:CD82 antigen isoform X2 [Pseudomyrmex gracilis]|uniref:CD82 antigen isoform X2 n=1 Tax=Pseudomyrmex gracilis TaxID=219809 RepID=UPI000994B825|nr:CD82 antigen isoform X2 [Pseudomyrmex gracilis]